MSADLTGALLEAARPARPTKRPDPHWPPTTGEQAPEGRDARVVRVADVQPEPVEWLWRGRIPLGKLTLLDGDPGLGKSTLTAALAASITTGAELPGGGDLDGPAGVVLVNLEDGVADTIRPRLEAAGADLTRCYVITGIGEHNRTPSIPEDLDELERVVRETGARLVVLDPLMAVLSGTVNAHRDQDVRRALAPAAAMAERTGAAVLVIRHLNKSADAPALYRGGGSIGIMGAVRSALLLAPHPEAEGDEDPRRILAPLKSNLAPPGARRALELSLVPSPDNHVAVVAWGGESRTTAAQLLARPERDAPDSDAVEWLKAALKEGERPVADLRAAASSAGMSWDALKRAKSRAGVISRKAGFDGAGWVWALKPPSEPQSPAPLRPSKEAPGRPPANREQSPNAPKGAKSAKGAGVLGTPPKGASFGVAEFAECHPPGCRCAGDDCGVAAP